MLTASANGVVRRTCSRRATPSLIFARLTPSHGRNLGALSSSRLHFSSTAVTFDTTKAPGSVERKLSTLDMALVRQIKAELMAVDDNHDGRLQAEELKKLLQKHSNAFTDEEIVEIGELYYAGKAGGSVSFDRFIEAVDLAAAGKQKQEEWKSPNKHQHFKETGRHPLGVGRDVLEYYQSGKAHHGHYTPEELDVKATHVSPATTLDHIAFSAVKVVRFVFDTATGWRNDNITVNNILNRVIFLETIAAVPGMVAAIVRHFKSLRTMAPDGGLLQMFLEEANNERMHLLTFVRMKDPNFFFRVCVIGGQFGFGSFFFIAYIISPKFCHRFVGYVEEEAVSTYTKIIKAIETAPEGTELASWRTDEAPEIAKAYWKLGENGTILQLMNAVRADEAEHRDVNHLVSGLKEGQFNPLYDPASKLDMMLLKYVEDIMTKNKDAALKSVPKST